MKKNLKIVVGILMVIILYFVIDFICIFTINKPPFAVKEDNGDLVNIIYRGLFYDTYNCIEYSVPQIKSKVAKFTCSINVKEDAELNEVKGVSMTIKLGTLTKTGATVIITDTNKHKYDYGEEFRIDVKENNSWKELERADGVAFNAIAYLVNENNKLELKQNWDRLYGELSKGEYRLVKNVCISDFCKDKKEFSVEFIIK